jgi:ketosteroid isomerase-like protein
VKEKKVMSTTTVARRMLLKGGACALAGAGALPGLARAGTAGGLSPQCDATIRRYYAAWETKDWHPIDLLITDDFTFTSAHNDDHISKSVFKVRCWQSQVDLIRHFDLVHVFGSGNEALVLYVCHVKGDKTVRNVEYVRCRDERIEAIECYFGSPLSFPSAVVTGHS